MVFKVVLIIVSAILTLLVLFQEGPLRGGLESAFSGANLSLFEESKARGSAKKLSIATDIVILAFLVLTVVAMYL